MTAPWYAAWAAKHALTFGLGDDTFLSTILSWEDLFAAAGYSEADLYAATTTLALSGRKLERWHHLAAITAHVRESRAVQYRRREAEAAADPGTGEGVCTLCSDTGYVIVPHPDGIAGGAWVPIKCTRSTASYYTAAVGCHCHRGRLMLSRRGDRRPITIADYEAVNPRWQIQLAQHDAELLERSRLRVAS